MSELKTNADIAAYVQERIENGFAEFERTMDVVNRAVRLERERCIDIALRSEPPYDDLVRSGAWHSCARDIEQKIRGGE